MCLFCITIATLCQEQVTVPTSGRITVTSSNYPANYAPNTDCLWLFNAQNTGTQFRIVIKGLETADSSDQIVIGSQNNPDDASSILRTYWGTTPTFPVVFTNPTDTMWMTFKTDSTKQSKGFDIEVQDITYRKCCSSFN